MAGKGDAEGMEKGIDSFQKAFDGRSPSHVARAPGRVNLIGEHTDYNGLPVFPMALRQEIRVVFRPRGDDLVQVFNPDPEFRPRRFTLSGEIPRDVPGDWGNYLKAPCQALARRFGTLRGMDALLTSTVPVASGLSSSSALVIAMGRALLHANHLEVPTLDLADEMARAERYTGTQGGGMDQAISLGAVEGHASRIEFEPLRMFETPVPPGWHFVVGHTMVRAEKSGPAQAAYNRRRLECGEALDLLGAPIGSNGKVTYAEILERESLRDLLSLAQGNLPPTLLQRFRHVVTEGTRVYQAEEAMQKGDLLTFGILMDASHESLRADYEVSSPELDRMVELAREGGAAGARLTGAGFGGCMVALADDARLPSVVSSLEVYFRERGIEGDLSRALFLAEPAGGAEVLTLD